jgi:hypothetical protein
LHDAAATAVIGGSSRTSRAFSQRRTKRCSFPHIAHAGFGAVEKLVKVGEMVPFPGFSRVRFFGPILSFQ